MTWLNAKTFLTLASAGILLTANGCSTGDESGLCKPAKNSGMTAATSDISGDPWTLEITPKDGIIQKCASTSETGTLRVFAVIKDSQKIAKGGLAINAAVGEISGGILKLASQDTNTDSCGTASFDISWKCPDSAGDERAGSILIWSGALSNSATITINHFVPVTGTTGLVDP